MESTETATDFKSGYKKKSESVRTMKGEIWRSYEHIKTILWQKSTENGE